MRRVALVSCVDLPAWEVDDLPLIAALEALGVEVARPAWSDPSVDWAAFDLALLRTPWDYSDQVEAFLAWAHAAAAVTRLEHPPEVLRWNLRKTYLRDLAAAGVPIAPTAFFDAPTDVAGVMAARGWTSGFLKPVVGASARETLRFSLSSSSARPGWGTLADAQAHVDRVCAVEPLMLQPYLPAVETEGELSLILIDGAPTHAVRKVPVAGDYRVQDDYGAHDEPYPLGGELAALAQATLAATARLLPVPLLYARIDALRLPSGALVLNELEIVEPSLFFRHGPDAAARLAAAVVARLPGGR